MLKNSEQARRTPTFAEEILQAEAIEGEGVKPPEKSFWAKYVRTYCFGIEFLLHDPAAFFKPLGV